MAGKTSSRSSPTLGLWRRITFVLWIQALCWSPVARSDIPQPPILLLTAQDNGTEPQTTFSCTTPIHGYITLPKKTTGRHVLEAIWTGPQHTVVQHSRDDVTLPEAGRRSVNVWLQFTKEGILRNPFSVQDSGDTDRRAYDGNWVVEIMWDHQTLARSDFQIHCL